MAQVKIDENIYLLLENHFLNKHVFSEAEEKEIVKFFATKSWARYNRENHIDDYKRDARLKKMLGD